MALLMLLMPKPDDPAPSPAIGRARRRGLGWWWLLIVAVMLLAVALALRHSFGSHDALVPWAEANQGLLSLLALTAALAIALFENGRALRASDEERRQFVDFLLSVIDELDAFTASDEITKLVGNPAALEQRWCLGSAPLRFTIDTARHALVRDVLLAIELNRLHLAMAWGIRTTNDTNISTPEQMRAFLAEVRAKIAARR